MSALQRFFLAVLPQRWGESMKRDSKAWRFRCITCDFSRSVWDAGGIRWKAASRGKRTMIYCTVCGKLRSAAVEYRPDDSTDDALEHSPGVASPPTPSSASRSKSEKVFAPPSSATFQAPGQPRSSRG